MDALKRTGLAERTGRGIDRIFEGALNYGRPLPDYSRSNRRGVSVLLPRSVPDKAFVELLAEERERSGKSMSLDGLLFWTSSRVNVVVALMCCRAPWT